MASQYGPTPSEFRALCDAAGASGTILSYGPGCTIVAQGDPCDSVFHVEQGRVRLSVLDAGGKEAIIGILAPGAFLGEEAFSGPSVHRHTATAMSPASLLVISTPQMARLLRTNQAVSDHVVAHLLERHLRLESDLSDQLLHSTEQRVARTLLMLAGCKGGRQDSCVLPHVSQSLIAEMVGTTRSHVNAFMRKFTKLGLLENRCGVLCVTPSLFNVVEHDRMPRVPNSTARAAAGCSILTRQSPDSVSRVDP